MARKATTSPSVDIDADAYYDMKVAAPHVSGRTRFSPLNGYRVKGYILKSIPAHKIASYELAK